MFSQFGRLVKSEHVQSIRMKSPGMYVFHVASFFSAMTSPGMMIGASDLSVIVDTHEIEVFQLENRRTIIRQMGE